MTGSETLTVEYSGVVTYHRVLERVGNWLHVETILESTGKRHPQAGEPEWISFIPNDGTGATMLIHDDYPDYYTAIERHERAYYEQL